MPKIYDLKTPYGDYKCYVKRSTYKNDGSLAVWLEEVDGSPVCKVTTNIDNPMASKSLAFVDTNNCPYIEDFLKSSGLAKETIVRAQSGFCVYPLYWFDIDEIEEAE